MLNYKELYTYFSNIQIPKKFETFFNLDNGYTIQFKQIKYVYIMKAIDLIYNEFNENFIPKKNKTNYLSLKKRESYISFIKDIDKKYNKETILLNFKIIDDVYKELIINLTIYYWSKDKLKNPLYINELKRYMMNNIQKRDMLENYYNLKELIEFFIEKDKIQLEYNNKEASKINIYYTAAALGNIGVNILELNKFNFDTDLKLEFENTLKNMKTCGKKRPKVVDVKRELDTLPNHLLFIICSYMNLETIYNFMTVNKKLYNIAYKSGPYFKDVWSFNNLNSIKRMFYTDIDDLESIIINLSNFKKEYGNYFSNLNKSNFINLFEQVITLSKQLKNKFIIYNEKGELTRDYEYIDYGKKYIEYYFNFFKESYNYYYKSQQNFIENKLKIITFKNKLIKFESLFLKVKEYFSGSDRSTNVLFDKDEPYNYLSNKYISYDVLFNRLSKKISDFIKKISDFIKKIIILPDNLTKYLDDVNTEYNKKIIILPVIITNYLDDVNTEYIKIKNNNKNTKFVRALSFHQVSKKQFYEMYEPIGVNNLDNFIFPDYDPNDGDYETNYDFDITEWKDASKYFYITDMSFTQLISYQNLHNDLLKFLKSIVKNLKRLSFIRCNLSSIKNPSKLNTAFNLYFENLIYLNLNNSRINFKSLLKIRFKKLEQLLINGLVNPIDVKDLLKFIKKLSFKKLPREKIIYLSMNDLTLIGEVNQYLPVIVSNLKKFENLNSLMIGNNDNMIKYFFAKFFAIDKEFGFFIDPEEKKNKLTVLNIRDSGADTDIIDSWFLHFENIEKLNISNTNASGAGFNHLHKIKWLNISDCDIVLDNFKYLNNILDTLIFIRVKIFDTFRSGIDPKLLKVLHELRSPKKIAFGFTHPENMDEYVMKKYVSFYLSVLKEFSIYKIDYFYIECDENIAWYFMDKFKSIKNTIDNIKILNINDIYYYNYGEDIGRKDMEKRYGEKIFFLKDI